MPREPVNAGNEHVATQDVEEEAEEDEEEEEEVTSPVVAPRATPPIAAPPPPTPVVPKDPGKDKDEDLETLLP